MNATSENLPALRHSLYSLLIVLAAAMAVGRILAVELVYEPSLSQDWPNDPGHPRRAWPATAPRAMPTFSSNDRSRWAAVRALVDEGTWVIGRRDHETGKDSGIIFEDGWQSVDKMLNPTTLEFYSTKPPLLTFLVACEYALLKKTLGWSLRAENGSTWDHRFAIVRVCLLTFNVLPFVVYLWLLTRLAERFGTTDWGRIFMVAAACFATLMTPFLIALNNHTLATCSVVVAVYTAVRLLSSSNSAWGWFVLAGFFAGFTAVNELPAAAFAAGLGLVLLVRFPRQTLAAYMPAALVPVAALLALNYAELGELNLGYSKFGTEWYEYEGSHWKNLPDKSKRGIDWARNRETRGAYAFHLLLGHHGWFSLTPIYLLALGGMGLGARLLAKTPPHPQPLSPEAGERGEGRYHEVAEREAIYSPLPRSGGEGLGVRGTTSLLPRVWAELAVGTALLSCIVIGYYIYKSDNYGGWSNGPRWLMWLAPLWLLTLLPCVDRLGQRRGGRALCLVLLALSVLSAHYWDWNPWRHPWIYNWMDSQGWIPY